MADALRIPLYGKRRRLLGYWYLRRTTDDEYLVSFRYPGQKHKLRKTDDPEHAVSLLYDAYIGFLGKRLSEVEKQLAELPKREYGKRGFRKGWLRRLKHELERERRQYVEEGRQELLAKLGELRKRGWPIPPLPSLPWNKVDGTKAASVAWIPEGTGAGDSARVPGSGASNLEDMRDASDVVPEGEKSPGERGDRDSGARDLHASGSQTPVFAPFGSGPPKIRKRSEGSVFPWSLGQGVWNLSGAGPTDSEGSRDTDGKGASEAPERTSREETGTESEAREGGEETSAGS